jgi:SAM-dependent methyltransferase
MSVFGADYSHYYDRFYPDKDYAAEAAFVRNIIRRYKPRAHSMLDLGCGSARHAVEFARAGFAVTGVDRSGDMIARAKDRVGQLPGSISSQVTLVEGDATNYTPTAKYDAVVSLFHVVSYQTSNDALAGIFRTVRSALSPEGLFVFDFWHGSAVLTLQPAVRVKSVADSDVHVTRIAEPECQFNRNVVNVRYTIIAIDQRNGRSRQLVETHSMRYLFVPEIAMLAEHHNFELTEIGAWLTGQTIDEHCWSGYAAMRMLPILNAN